MTDAHCSTALQAMPTPNFVFRLPVPERAALLEMAKLYGSPNVSAFLREMVGAMCSGSPERVKDFNVRLFSKVGEQLALKLSAPAMEMAAAAPERTARKPRKKRRPRAKRT